MHIPTPQNKEQSQLHTLISIAAEQSLVHSDYSAWA